eukprot:Gb_11974 [translate_table: standard]
MAKADDGTTLAWEQHDVQEKLKGLGAAVHGLSEKCGDDNALADHEVEMRNITCKRFTIRGYVAMKRELDRKTCWPFLQHFLETRLEEECCPTLPPIEIPEYRWWNCQNCLCNNKTPADRSIEKSYVNDLNNSPDKNYGFHSSASTHSVDKFQKSMSNAGLHENCKENILDHTELVECLTVELKSSDGSSSACDIVSDKNDEEVMTDKIMEKSRIGNALPMELEIGKLENLDSEERRTALWNSSTSTNSEGNISKTERIYHQQEEEIACAEMGQIAAQTIPSDLHRNTDDEIGSNVKQDEASGHVSNTWEYFSKSRNIFEEISKKIKEKEIQQATSQILTLDSETCEADDIGLDINKLETINSAHKGISYGEKDHPGHLTEEKENETSSWNVIEPSIPQTAEVSIPNEDHVHVPSDARTDVTCMNMNGNGSSSPANTNINDFKQSKCHIDRSTNVMGNTVLLEETGKSQANETKNKRKSQKKRSIADIIASEPLPMDSWNKETEESNLADTVEETICMTDNCDQFTLQTNSTKGMKDAVKKSSKSKVERSAIPEGNSIIHGKQRPEKLKVRKKQRGLGVQSGDPFSAYIKKDSIDSSKSEPITNNLQMPQGTSHLLRASRDKALLDFFHLENGQVKRYSELDEEIPMDIVELMAKIQHERGLSRLENVHKGHYRQKDKSVMRMKVKATDFVPVTEPAEIEGTYRKQEPGIKKNVTHSNEANQVIPETYLRSSTGSDTLVDSSKMHTSPISARSYSTNSGLEGMKFVPFQNYSALLQSPEVFNPWGKCSSGFATSVISGANAACNPPLPIFGGGIPHVAISNCDPEVNYYANGRVLTSVWPQGAAADVGHTQMQNLCRDYSSIPSNSTNPVPQKFQNKSQASFHHYWISSPINSQECVTKPQSLSPITADGNSGPEIAGSKFDFLHQSQKDKGISSGRTDQAFNPTFFNGQNNSIIMPQINVQVSTIGNEGNSSVPVLRLMGQSLSVPIGCGNEKYMATENTENMNFSKLLEQYSQKHASWFHPVTCASSRVIEKDQKEGFFQGERVFNGSKPSQDNLYIKDQTMSSSRIIPPVPKFRPFENSVLNGYPETGSTSSTVPGNMNASVQSLSMERTISPFQGTLLFGMKQKDGLQCTHAIKTCDDQSDTFYNLPPSSHSTELTKGLSSPTKGLRSFRPPPTKAQLNRYHRSALDIYLENRYRRLQSSRASGTNSKQKSEDAEKTNRHPPVNLNQENQETPLSGKRACNIEICTLNRNPAEINLDDGEHRDSFGYQHLLLGEKVLSFGKRSRNIINSPGQKRRRTLKRRHLQECFAQGGDYVDEPNRRNENMDTVWREMAPGKQLGGNIIPVADKTLCASSGITKIMVSEPN